MRELFTFKLELFEICAEETLFDITCVQIALFIVKSFAAFVLYGLILQYVQSICKVEHCSHKI
jgi:hypothetical protein